MDLWCCALVLVGESVDKGVLGGVRAQCGEMFKGCCCDFLYVRY